MSRAFIIWTAGIFTVAVTVGAFMLMARFVSGPNSSSTFTALNVDGYSQMGAVIPAIFNMKNSEVVYDWAITTDDETGQETLIETSTFTTDGWEYELLLATGKVTPEDVEYTVSRYLTLTVRNPLRDEEVSYVDLGVDGVIESVYVDDANVTSSRLLAFGQEEYERVLEGAYKKLSR
jgi:hypothetical protein